MWRLWCIGADMANVMYLVHRMPYPPNKGDKVRSFHMLEQLLQNHRVFLGTFLDDPADEEHVPGLASMCAELHLERLKRPWSTLRALRGVVQNKPLSVSHYASSSMRQWVRTTLTQHHMDACVVVSSPMAAYLMPDPQLTRNLILDLVDVDSQKWRRISAAKRWPMSWVLRREAGLLLGHERKAVMAARQSFLVTERETQLFESVAPECRGRVQTMGNGVDSAFFAVSHACASPFPSGEQAVVFVGTMDYWPNIDAIQWFASEVLPALRKTCPAAVLHVVGRNPAPEVLALASPAVRITGTVPDVRPFLQYASAVVAPMRVSPGLPNKLLEALAMQQPVVTTPGCALAIDSYERAGVLVADGTDAWVDQVRRLLTQPERKLVLGGLARQHVLSHFRWADRLAPLRRSLLVDQEGESK